MTVIACYLRWTFALLVAILLIPPASANEADGVAELILESPSGVRTPALLLDTRIEGTVDGLVATLKLRQRFQNTSEEWVNGEYLFPLPTGAAVDGLVLETEGKRIHGVVKEKRQAKKEFEAAKASGKKAGLVVQRRPNLFSMSLANIPPNGEVIAEVTWVETVDFAGGRFSLALPTTLTPRFVPGSPVLPTGATDDFEETASLQVEAGSGWATNTDQVPDAATITPPQLPADQLIGSHQFSLGLEIQPGIAITGVTSVSHGLKVEESANGGRYRISLAEGSATMDRDLVMEWSPAGSALPEAAAFRQEMDGEDYTLLMVMPPVQNVVQTLPRELIFVIDSSGSMAGVSMPQAKQGLKTALGYLTVNDRFNVIDFDSSASALFHAPIDASARAIQTANGFVDGLVADGGTNMEAALDLAFNQPVGEGYLRQIVFITDGSVGNEAALFELIHRRLGDARLFTMGIGVAPNAHFMRGAARFGRGSYHFIRDLAQASVRMGELFTRINRPVMRDITVTWPDGTEVETVPERVSDLYLGEPLMVLSRSAGMPDSATVRGNLSGKPWERTIAISSAPSAENLDKLWARGKVEQLLSRQIMTGKPVNDARDEIVSLGVRHQLATRFTSFVAVEEKISRPVDQIAKDKTVPNAMPAGSQMSIPMPNTATPATLLSLLGLLMFALAGLLKLQTRKTGGRR